MLGFLELPEDDVPPELIWHHDSQMAKWWEDVKFRRKNPGAEPLEDVDTTDNELAQQYK